MRYFKSTVTSPWMLSMCGLIFLAVIVLLSGFPGSSAGAQQPKVDICHQTGNGSYHSITVAAPAVPAHLAHGDVPVGGACTVGVGACQATGTMACTPGGAVCNAVPGAPSAEICDGADNDCDGAVDEGNVCQPACASHADCNDGNSCTIDACVAGVCRNNPAAAGQACDDGLFCTVSDVCNGAGQCVAGFLRVCNASACQIGVCDEGTDQCLSQNAPDGTPSGQTCGTGACQSFGICQNGVGQTCVPGPASPEACADGIDNNCNGTVDEGC